MSPRVLPLLLASFLIVLVSCGSSDSPLVSADPASSVVESTSTSPDDTSATSEPATEEPSNDKPEVNVPNGDAPTELVVDDLVEGTGKEAATGDYLVMHYVGVRHSDGGQFDASWDRGETFSFTLGAGRVIQGWDQGIVGMKVGGRRLLSIPADLAYGDTARGEDIPANSALVFVVDLVAAATPPTVENAPAPVTELEVTVLEDGSGDVVAEGDTISMHYRAVLQTTGEVFASSWESGQPAIFQVAAAESQAIPAWDEAIPGLRVGDVVRLVIPPELGITDETGQIPADATIITELTILEIVG